MLGLREPHIYGRTALGEIERACRACAESAGAALDFMQSDQEGELIAAIQRARGTADAIVFNPAGYSFTSVALLDALAMFEGPKIEVHVSNIHARDEMHRHSRVSAYADGVICGLGPFGYVAALRAALHLLAKR